MAKLYAVANQEVARILSEIGTYLDMQGVAWKPRAYEKASELVSGMERELADIYAEGGVRALKDLPGVGVAIAEKLEELFRTGKLRYYEELKKAVPVKLAELRGVEGLGPKKIAHLYRSLGVRDLKGLERAAKTGKIAQLEGFGEKSAENILKGVSFVRGGGGRVPIFTAIPEVRRIAELLRGHSAVTKLTIAGSVRRMKETIGDVDMLVVSRKPKAVMDHFVSLPGVARVYAHGDTKSSVLFRSGLQADLRVVPAGSYGAALNYFTGSKDHNVALRQLAITKGLKLNEYGLFRATSDKRHGIKVAGETEEGIYKALRLDYIEPELREASDELEAARTGKLPKLIGYDDLRGDLQTQTNWTDGKDSIEAMAKSAAAKGLEYIAITDHTHSLTITNGLDEKRIMKQWAEIDRVNKKCQASGITCRVLKGTECDILPDGRLDLPDAVLAKLDVVGVSVHSHAKLPRAAQTKRIIRAIENPHVDILFHPTGRTVGKRPPYEVDMDAVIKAAKRTGVVLEANASERLDLKDEHICAAVTAGVKLAISSDAHTATGIGECEFGIAQARRGWATRDDVVNAWPLEKLRKTLR
jgi:DNA polymerase (family 10)